MCRSDLLSRTFAFVGRHTLPIFLLHVSIQKALLQLDTRYRLLPDQSWCRGIATASLAILVSIAIEHYAMAALKWLRSQSLSERAA